MPIYEYECESCGSVFELMQSVNARPPKQCETDSCKGKPRRKVSASGFILKGSGWYATDYPSEARKKGWEQESKQASGSETPAAAPSSGDSCSTPGCGNTATTTAPKPKSNPIAEANKNPYSGGKKKTRKTTTKNSK